MELRWGSRTYVMGIVNVTPDSFSGDGIAGPGRDIVNCGKGRDFVRSDFNDVVKNCERGVSGGP